MDDSLLIMCLPPGRPPPAVASAHTSSLLSDERLPPLRSFYYAAASVEPCTVTTTVLFIALSLCSHSQIPCLRKRERACGNKKDDAQRIRWSAGRPQQQQTVARTQQGGSSRRYACGRRRSRWRSAFISLPSSLRKNPPPLVAGQETHHFPRLRRPFIMGMFSEQPNIDDLQCAAAGGNGDERRRAVVSAGRGSHKMRRRERESAPQRAAHGLVGRRRCQRAHQACRRSLHNRSPHRRRRKTHRASGCQLVATCDRRHRERHAAASQAERVTAGAAAPCAPSSVCRQGAFAP